MTDFKPTANRSQDERLRRLGHWLSVVGVLAIAASLLIMRVDQQLSSAIRLGKIPGDLRKMIDLSEAFAHGSGVAAILVALYLCSSRSRAAVWIAVMMTITSGLAANGLKAVFTRARPYTFDAAAGSTDIAGLDIFGGGSFWNASIRSFPSGHTATAWGLAIGLSLLYPRGTAVFIVLGCLATFQRLVSGAHFPSDTLAGFGIACLACAAVLMVPRARQNLLRPDRS